MSLSVAIAAAVTVAVAVAVAIALASLDIVLFVCHPRRPHHRSLCHRRRRRCSPTTHFAVAIALAAIALFVAHHSRC